MTSGYVFGMVGLRPEATPLFVPRLSRSRPSRAALCRSGLVDHLAQKVLSPCPRAERIHAVFLDRQKAQIGEACLAMGNSCMVTLKLRDLFAPALAASASGLVLAHNHPSGDCRPSASDYQATCKIARVSRSLDLELIDHLIFTEDSVFSMRRGRRV